MLSKSLLIIAAVLTAAVVVVAAAAVVLTSNDGPGNPGNPNNPNNPTLPPIGTFSNIGPRDNNYDDPADGIHVATNGNDSTADGSRNRPYKSINAALGAADPGDTIILHNGIYKEGREVRITKSNITIKSAKGEWARIDLPFPANPMDQNDGNSAIHYEPEVSGGKLQCIEVTGGWYAICTESKWRWGGSDDYVATTGITIEDCRLHDSRFDVIKVKPNCDNITIQYNEIYNSGMAFPAGSSLTGENNAEGIDNVNGDNMIVRNNFIHDICSNGVYAKGGATNCLIENNHIERAYGAGIMIGFDTNLEYFDTAVNPQYYENINGVARNNLIVNTGWEGIGLYASKGAKVYNNTLVNVANVASIRHSAIYFGIAPQDGTPFPGSPANVSPEIYNNIVSQPNNIVTSMVDIRYAVEQGHVLSALSGNPTMYNNCYYIAGKTAAFSDGRTPNDTSMGLAGWKSHISGESGSIEVNPGLDSNYKPANSQCTGMGCKFA